jgi:3D-(3,5/4)-trihydroxycyclohexane-1,2-dione acylhydrolase (decyclizing)
VADAKLGLRGLTEALEGWRAPEDWADKVRAERRRWERALADDLQPRQGERISQGQALRTLNEEAGPRDWLVVASGTPHVDVHKLWEPTTPCMMEVGFSCMGGEIPAALGVRLARPDLDEIYVTIGDGTYLLGGSTELVTACQERLKLTVLVFENGGYQSIHALQRSKTGRSFGLEFEVEVDYAANARSLGCATYEPRSVDELRDALGAARDETRAVVIVVRVEPHRLLLGSDCWWDVGVPEVSDWPETRRLAAEHAQRRALQRLLV